MERKEKGMLYRVDDPEIRKLQNHQLVLLADYNRMDLADWTSRRALLMELFASFGKDSFVEGRIYANWGGYFCHVGNHVYISFNLTMVDDGEGRIEDHALIGPGVTLISGSHPNDPMLRKDLWQYTDPVRIGENAWIGAGAIVLPGVSIGR
ncbi:maltose acetyltransferase domain-containing protein, partial [Faecalibaculum rodentium]